MTTEAPVLQCFLSMWCKPHNLRKKTVEILREFQLIPSCLHCFLMTSPEVECQSSRLRLVLSFHAEKLRALKLKFLSTFSCVHCFCPSVHRRGVGWGCQKLKFAQNVTGSLPSARSHGETATATAICDKNGLHRMSIGRTTWCDCDCELRLRHTGVADMIAVNSSCIPQMFLLASLFFYPFLS